MFGILDLPVTVIPVVFGGWINHWTGFDAYLLEQVPHILVDVLLKREEEEKGNKIKKKSKSDTTFPKFKSKFSLHEILNCSLSSWKVANISQLNLINVPTWLFSLRTLD